MLGGDAFESVFVTFAIVSTVAVVLSVFIFVIINMVKSRNKFDNIVGKMVDNIKREEEESTPSHECKYCGAMVPDDEKVCPSCGAKQSKE